MNSSKLTMESLVHPASAVSLQSLLTLCNPIDSSPPGFPVPGILQARTLEWVAISFSNAWKWKVKVKSLSRVGLLATWTAAYQAPPSMEFSRQEYWSGLPLPSPNLMLGTLKQCAVFSGNLWNWNLCLTIVNMLSDFQLSIKKKILLVFYFILEYSWWTMLC